MTHHPIPDILRIDIIHNDGRISYDPNTITVEAIEFPERITELKGIGAPSAISGEPGLIYSTDEATLCLTGYEIIALVSRALTPEAYFSLYRKVGAIFEIHDDFYDPGTGEALQPKI